MRKVRVRVVVDGSTVTERVIDGDEDQEMSIPFQVTPGEGLYQPHFVLVDIEGNES